MRSKAKVSGIIVLLLFFFSSIVITTNIRAQCVSDFADSTQCHNTAYFTDLSYTTTPGDFIVSWNWDFGDGGTSVQQNPMYTYAAGGDYPVTLIIESDLGCSDTLTNIVIILSPMEAGFSYSTNCLTVSFTDTSYVDPNDSIISWSWDFGDGNTSSLQNPVHTYAGGGNYIVTLFTTCECLGIDIASHAVSINNPIANFTDSSSCNYKIYFTDLSIANASGITAWLWEFGDGISSTLQHPVHTYSGAGSYNVCLKVENNNGCIDSLLRSVVVNSSPNSDFDYSISSSSYSVNFVDQSTSQHGFLTDWYWDFGDGWTASIQNPEHSYVDPGSYLVTLAIHASCGGTDTVSKEIEIPESFAIGTNEAINAEISIYPNPANDKITIRSTVVIDQLRIIDINGRSIDVISFGFDQSNISTTDLNNGVYILEVTSGNKTIPKKFIIRH